MVCNGNMIGLSFEGFILVFVPGIVDSLLWLQTYCIQGQIGHTLSVICVGITHMIVYQCFICVVSLCPSGLFGCHLLIL